MEGRREKGETADMVPVDMGQQHGRVVQVFADQPVAQIADAGSGIEDDPRAAAGDFDTACIAADGYMLCRRTGNAASNTPERSEERRVGKECRTRWSPYQ